MGEDGFMMGLFGRVAENQGRNVVAARFGNLSIVAQDDVPLRDYGERPAHVFDMHSRPGFSGSPVFVYRTPDGDFSKFTQRAAPFPSSLAIMGIRSIEDVWQAAAEYVEERRHLPQSMLLLLGIHVAQYRDVVQIEDATPAEVARAVREGDKLYIPSSMTIVAPAWAILDLVDRPRLTMQRVEREKGDPPPLTVEEYANRQAAAARAGSAGSASPPPPASRGEPSEAPSSGS